MPTPRLRTVVRVGPDAAVLAYEHCEGTTLAERNRCTDEELSRVWDTVTRLHARHVAHRGLTADRILFTPGGQVMLLAAGRATARAARRYRRAPAPMICGAPTSRASSSSAMGDTVTR